ncbi:mandelate racemase/muconate lactonizing enzyme family protein [Salinactinospora qingdaonensis]|uniref:Mandelate racemase/muconate lactonizing enzyme family protein n=2 Tax=Salinactinospora qingdaonensis TaxID=702744 RepID=A0ABP7FKR3_9ACTN
MITDVTAEAYRLPLARPWDGGVAHNDLIVVTVDTDTGARGTGFAWTPRVGGGAVAALLREDCPEALLGQPVQPAPRWTELRHHLREAGAGGITAMALAAVDVALWDLAARASDSPLVDHIGRHRTSAAAYGSGINLDYSRDALLEQVRRWLGAGHDAVKIKVGSADTDRDVDRVATVRRLIGPRRRLMLDANQRWDLPTAEHALRRLARFDPYWIEEPLPADQLAAHQRLRQRCGVPIAVGENLRTVGEFEEYLRAGACDIAQPNVVRVGGITPFLRVAQTAAATGVPVAPHLLPELSAQLALCVPLVSMVEDIEDASFAALGALAQPSGVTIEAGTVRCATGPGHGLVFSPAAMQRRPPP